MQKEKKMKKIDGTCNGCLSNSGDGIEIYCYFKGVGHIEYCPCLECLVKPMCKYYCDVHKQGIDNEKASV